MRYNISAISRAMDFNAPPITRNVMGSTSHGVHQRAVTGPGEVLAPI